MRMQQVAGFSKFRQVKFTLLENLISRMAGPFSTALLKTLI
jgi:hypothetical protein